MKIVMHNLEQLLIALDQVLRVLIALFSASKGWADETMSAHCWRCYRDGKPWGKLLMPFVDWLFAWQAVDPLIVDENGEPITGHCRRAFEKELKRGNLPPEYR